MKHITLLLVLLLWPLVVSAALELDSSDRISGVSNITGTSGSSYISNMYFTYGNLIGFPLACSSNEVAVGINSTSTRCLNLFSSSGLGAVSAVQTSTDKYLFGGADYGTVVLRLNETVLNSTIDGREDDTYVDSACPTGEYIWNISASTIYCRADSDTTYSAGNGITLTGTVFSVSAGAGLVQLTGGLSADSTVLVNWSAGRATFLNSSDYCSNGEVYVWGTGCVSNTSIGISYTNGTGLLLSGGEFSLVDPTDDDTYVNAACSAGNYVYNISGSTIYCSTPSGSGDITKVEGLDEWLYNGSDSGDVGLRFNVSAGDARWVYTNGTGLLLSSNEFSANCEAITGSSDLCDGSDAGGYDFQCSAGNYVYNLTPDGNYLCSAPSGSGDITSVQSLNPFIYNGSDSGDVGLVFNTTALDEHSVGGMVGGKIGNMIVYSTAGLDAANITSGEIGDAYISDTITASNYVRKNTWTDHDDYPAACGVGEYVRGIGDTLTCVSDSDTTYTAGTGLILSGTEFSSNETYVNSTIDDKIVTVLHNISQYEIVAGTGAGSVDDTVHNDGAYDGVTFNLTESTDSPGLDARFNFTGIIDFNGGIIRYRTSDLSGDAPVIQLWDYGDSEWDEFPDMSEIYTFKTISEPVYYASRYIDNGVVQMRVYKSSNGNTQNEYYIDWVALSQGPGTPSGQEVDPFSYHTDDDIDASGYHVIADNVSASLYCNQTSGGTCQTLNVWDTDTTYTAGNGISLSGTQFTVAGNLGLTQDTDGLSITPSYFDGIYLNTSKCGDAEVYVWGAGCVVNTSIGSDTTYTGSNGVVLVGNDFQLDWSTVESEYLNKSLCSAGELYVADAGCVDNQSIGMPDTFSDTAWVDLGGYITSNVSVNHGNVDVSNNLTVSGYVGVGTSSPGNRLEVVGDANVTGNITSSTHITSDLFVEDVLCFGSDCGGCQYWNGSAIIMEVPCTAI